MPFDPSTAMLESAPTEAPPENFQPIESGLTPTKPAPIAFDPSTAQIEVDPGDRARDRMDRLDRSISTVASDLKNKAAAGANAMVGNIADVYGLVTGDMDNPVSEQAKSGQQYWEAKVSPQLKEQEAERRAHIDAADGEWAKAGTAIWETLKNPALLSSSLAEQAAQLVPVGAAGRAAGAVAKIAGAGRAAAGTAAVAGGVAAGAAMQGADTGGDAYDRLMALPDPVWAQNEDVRSLVMGGMDMKRAKEAVATRLSRNSAAVAAIASGALNLIPGARTLEKAMSGVPVVGGIVKRTVSGLVGEAAQEGLEESSGMAAQNYAVKQVDPTQSLKQGVGEAGGIGAVVGGPMGGVTGALAQQEQVSQPDVQPGTQPAANEPSVSDLIGEDVGTPNAGTRNPDGSTTFPAPNIPPGALEGSRGQPPTPITDANSPAVRGSVEDIAPEQVELAPPPAGQPLVNAAEDMQSEINALPPANNIDVNEQAMPVENIEAAPAPEPAFTDREYRRHWDEPTRALFDLADEAHTVDKKATESIIRSGADDATVARQLKEIIDGRTQSASEGNIGEAQGERETEAPAAAPSAEADTRGAEDRSVSGARAQLEAKRAAAKPAPIATDNIKPAAVTRGARAQLEKKRARTKGQTATTVQQQQPTEKQAKEPGISPDNASLTTTGGADLATSSQVEKPEVAPVDVAAHEAATSQKNDLPEPSDAQKEAGNFQKGHVRIGGLDISIENPAGSKRRPEWPALKSHYGYVKRTEGADGEHVDVFVKPGIVEDYNGPVFVVDQKKANGHFDEHKVLIGWQHEIQAKHAYSRNYTKGWKVGPITRMSMDEFKTWLKDGDTTKPTKSIEKDEGKFAASFGPEDDGFSAALKFISEDSAAFTYPRSDAKTLPAVAADVAKEIYPNVKVTSKAASPNADGVVTNYVISLGKPADKSRGPGGDAILRQYKNGTLELDVSLLGTGEGGSVIYQIVGDYAHNAGLVFVGDRHGLSAVAQIRRTDNMLSSAVRWGTTEHLHPHDLQMDPEVAGVRKLGWKVGDDANNLRELAITQSETMRRLVPEIRDLEYNPDTGQFTDKAGKEITDERFKIIARRARGRHLESAATGSSLPYETPGGSGSLKRAIWTRWLSHEASGPRWGQLLAQLSRQHDQSPGSGSAPRIIPPKTFYARGESATEQASPSAGLSASGVRDYLTTKMGPRAIRALIDSGKFKIVLSDDNELPPRARAAVSENKRIYGYFDPATQTSYIIADRLTDAGKKTGILEDAYSIFLHEVGVHYGMRQMLGDAMFNRVVAEVAAAAESGKGALGEAAAAARKRMSKKTLPEDINEETLAWLVTDRSNHKLNVVQKVIAKIRAFLVRKGFNGAISPDALVDLARGAAMRAGGQSISAVEDGDKFAASDSNDVETAIKTPAAKARTGLRQRARAIVKAIDAKLTPLATMEGRTEYLTSRYLTLGRIAQTQQEARRVYDLFRKLSDADGAKVYAYLTDTEGTLEGVDPAVKANATRVKAKIEETGKALVERGVIPIESFNKYEGRYLPRVYLAYLLGDRAVKAVGAGKTLSAQSYAKSRDENLPQEYRDLVLGEIKDPAFLASRALGVPLRDLAILNWLSQIAENRSWVLPGQTVEWTMPGFEKSRKVTPYWLKSEATSLRERAQHYQGQNKVDAMKLAAEMDATADAALSEAGIAVDQVPDGYKQIPNSSRYGAVRGLIVKSEIYDDIVGAGQVSADQNIIKRIFEGDIGRKVVSMWKISKVSLNPPAQIRNIISNMVMLHLSGVPMHKLPGYIARAAKEIRAKGRFYQIGVKYGITESTFAAQEMQRIERETMDYLMRSKGRFSVAGLKDYASRLVEWAGDKYQFSEMLGKLVKIMDSMEREGKSEADAAMAAQEWLFDYSLVGPNVRHLRSAPIGAPFITFATKVLPRMLEVAITAPWRFLPYAGLFYASSLALQAMTGADDDDLDKLKNSLPEWLQERGHVMMLPFKDEHGRWQFIDLGYFFPWTYWTELVTSMGGAVKDLFTEGHSDKFGKALMGSGILGGPIQDMIVAIKTGVDSFSGKDIADEHMTGGQWWAAIGTYLYGMAAPPWLTSKGAAGHIYEALTGSVNKDGTPRNTLSQAALRMVGANIYPVEPEKSRQQNILHKRYDIQKTKSLMTHIGRDQSLSEEKRNELIKDYREKIIKDVAALNQYIKDSAISPKLR